MLPLFFSRVLIAFSSQYQLTNVPLNQVLLMEVHLHHFHCVLTAAVLIEDSSWLILLLLLFCRRFHGGLWVIPINFKTSDSRFRSKNIPHHLLWNNVHFSLGDITWNRELYSIQSNLLLYVCFWKYSNTLS